MECGIQSVVTRDRREADAAVVAVARGCGALGRVTQRFPVLRSEIGFGERAAGGRELGGRELGSVR